MKIKPVIAVALLAAAALIVVCVGCKKTESDTEAVDVTKDAPYWPAPAFKLTDQDGKAFSSDQLKGKTWIATLFFTSCSGPCPMMSGRLEDIQGAVKDPNVMLVSFSIDPKRDTPQALKDYANRMDADPARWRFLCGTTADVQKVADGLKLVYDPTIVTNGQIMHDTRFLLIDKAGQVRGIYHTDDNADIEKLKSDARKLAAL